MVTRVNNILMEFIGIILNIKTAITIRNYNY